MIYQRMKKIILLLFALINFPFISSAQNPGEWMWINGSNTLNDMGNHGIKGVPSAANQPPALYEANEWTDLNGNFWLFGGSESVSGIFPNDLWTYDPVAGQW